MPLEPQEIPTSQFIRAQDVKPNIKRVIGGVITDRGVRQGGELLKEGPHSQIARGRVGSPEIDKGGEKTETITYHKPAYAAKIEAIENQVERYYQAGRLLDERYLVLLKLGGEKIGEPYEISQARKEIEMTHSRAREILQKLLPPERFLTDPKALADAIITELTDANGTPNNQQIEDIREQCRIAFEVEQKRLANTQTLPKVGFLTGYDKSRTGRPYVLVPGSTAKDFLPKFGSDD